MSHRSMVWVADVLEDIIEYARENKFEFLARDLSRVLKSHEQVCRDSDARLTSIIAIADVQPDHLFNLKEL